MLFNVGQKLIHKKDTGKDTGIITPCMVLQVLDKEYVVSLGGKKLTVPEEELWVGIYGTGPATGEGGWNLIKPESNTIVHQPERVVNLYYPSKDSRFTIESYPTQTKTND